MYIWIINHNAIPPSMGGLVRHYYFKKYLEKAGHTVELITSSKIHNTDVNMITDGRLYKKIEVDGIEYTFVRNRDFHGNGILRIVNILEFPQNLRQVCRKLERPDVLYVSSPDIVTAYAGVRMAKKMKKHIPDSGLVVFENCGHFCFLEDTLKFNAVVTEFFKED